MTETVAMRCEWCWRAMRWESNLPVRWKYNDEERAVLAAFAATVPLATHRYSPACRCILGTCNDAYLCAACADTTKDPKHIELLEDDEL